MKTKNCPHCRETGKIVNYETVLYLVKDIVSVSNDSDYYLCSNNDCDVVYFNCDQLIYTIDIDIFHLGNSSKQDLVCWCSSITKEELEKEIYDKNIETIKDVIKYVSKKNVTECTSKGENVCFSNEIKDLLNSIE